MIAALAIPLASMALRFSASDYFALMMLGLMLAIILAGGSLLKAFAMLVLEVLPGNGGAAQDTGRQASIGDRGMTG